MDGRRVGAGRRPDGAPRGEVRRPPDRDGRWDGRDFNSVGGVPAGRSVPICLTVYIYYYIYVGDFWFVFFSTFKYVFFSFVQFVIYLPTQYFKLHIWFLGHTQKPKVLVF